MRLTKYFPLLTIIVLVCCFLADCVKSDKCRALVLRGGGTKGGYEVGVLKAFLEKLPAGEMNYDVINGISIGALNGGTFSLFPPGEEQ